MKEDLLQYIWQFQQFEKKKLTTVQGQNLKIIKTGIYNTDSGPDFLQTQLLLDDMAFHGHVELHVRSANWYTHHHDKDSAYDNVVLHVVWQYDKPVIRKDGTSLPTLVLTKYIKPQLLDRYQLLAQNQSPVPCSSQLHKVSTKKWHKMLQKALLQRLNHKYNLVYKLLEANKNDSEATAYQLLAYNFGFKINSPAFLSLSKLVPLKLIQRNAPNLLYLEALLLGQAGLLSTAILTQEAMNNDYVSELTKTYSYLKHKHKLTTTLTPSQWKFFRLRPANAPFIRITQLASLLHTHPSIFYLLINTPVKKLYKELTIKQSPYWQEHYQLGKKSKKAIAGLGKNSIENLIINTVVPLLVAYGKLRDTEYYIDRALDVLHHLPAEQNSITKNWQKLGMPIQDAFASQGSLELFNNFCCLKKCLSCTIGKSLIRKK